MNKKYLLVLVAAILSVSYLSAQQRAARNQIRFQGPFIESFSKPTSEFFNFNPLSRDRAGEDDFRYFSGIPSLSEKGTDIMMYRIDPKDPAGAGRGPEMISKNWTHFGSYAVRLKIPDITKVQPNTGIVVGYFTYNVDPTYGQSEIDWEWLIADPEILYLGTWTGVRPQSNRVGRTLNMATGQIYSTSYRSEERTAGERKTISRGQLTGAQALPETITPIEGFNAAERFYTYGFDWYPDRMVWWILHPDTNEKILLFDYSNPTTLFPDQPASVGIPVNPSQYRLNYWHTNDWPVQTNPNSIELPLYRYELEIDWISFTPFDDLSKAWLEKNPTWQEQRQGSAGN